MHSGVKFAFAGRRSRSARSTVVKPSPRWPPASAPSAGAAGSLNSTAFIDTSVHCACLQLLIGRLNLNILD